LDLGGYPVTVADTAGLRESEDHIEVEGMRRAKNWAGNADLRVLLVVDGEYSIDDPAQFGCREGDLVLFNKSDLRDEREDIPSMGADWSLRTMVVSLVSNEGMGGVLDWLSSRARELMHVSGGPALTRVRHRSALERCVESVGAAINGIRDEAPPEVVAEDLRLACDDLGRVTGRVDVEDLLDVLFRDFCIGK
jgi:tRNA modification GTPase